MHLCVHGHTKYPQKVTISSCSLQGELGGNALPNSHLALAEMKPAPRGSVPEYIYLK